MSSRIQGDRGDGDSNNGGGAYNNITPRVSFAQMGGDNIIVPGSDGTTLDKQLIRCFNC